MIWLQYLLPQHWLSKLMFRFARIENTWLKNTFTRWFVKTYQVDLSEAQREKIEDYKTFNDFFTRRLKSGARVIAKCSIVCPVDGAVSQVGAINDAQIVQAKNHHYSVAQLLANNEKASEFSEGFFATIYLSPRDYHRIHMPYDGKLIAMDYISGDLFSVNQKTVQSVDGLFARNERVVCYFETEFGICGFVLVGAIFVGSMQTVWQGQITPPYTKKVQHFDYQNQNIRLKKGEEMGRFNMGSTVIMLMPNKEDKLNLKAGAVVKMGQALI
jgi:phosphatidylserine decarboxylase